MPTPKSRAVSAKKKTNRPVKRGRAGSKPGGALVKPSRAIPSKTSLFLYVRAGGRCEFDGCNKYLLEHGVTAAPGNFAEQAHIWAFQAGGPRGASAGRPREINNLSNLMLLCAECHHLVDVVRPSDFPVEVLRKFKKDHEARVYALTGLSKDRDTVPLVLKGLIAGRPMDISDEEMQTAVAPNYLRTRDKVEIDLTSLPDAADPAFWSSARSIIDRGLDALTRVEPRPNRSLRCSVFALAPIPLLAYLGSKLSDKQTVDLYQRHRDPESWNWNEGVGEARFKTEQVAKGSGAVGLTVNVSGRNGPEAVTPILPDATLYELTLDGAPPTPLILKTRGDLERFAAEYVRALERIRAAHPAVATLHVFPAVPAPVAITLGRARLPKVDPSFLIYDRDRRAGGFVPTLEIQ